MFYETILGKLNSSRLLKLVFGFHPQSELLVCDGRRETRQQVFEAILALAGGLQSLGIGPGQRVVTLLPACPEAVYTLFLPEMLGSVHVPLNPLLSERELVHILGECDPAVVVTCKRIYGQDFQAILERLRPNLPALRVIIMVDSKPLGGPLFYGMEELLSWRKSLASPRLDSRAAAVITYTSGTTGLAKGVVHSLPRMFSLVRPGLDLRYTQSLLLPFPPYQVGGMLGIAGTLIGGGKIILMEKFDPLRMLEIIQDEQVTQLAASPTMVRLMLRCLKGRSYDTGTLRRVTFGSEPCPPALAQAIYERFHCHIKNIYATTESLVISMSGPRDGWEIAGTTVGRPMPGVRLRIVDGERQPLPPGACGEVAVRSSQMMLGYLNDPDSTAQVMDPQGWFYTGDMGTMDRNGYLRLGDRKKDMIIRGGQNIYPAEVEQWLMTHPRIRKAAVVGIPQALVGETLWAFVEPQPGTELTSRQVLDHCRGYIAPFKIPEQVRFLEHLPVTSVGKVQKYKLRGLAEQEMNRG